MIKILMCILLACIILKVVQGEDILEPVKAGCTLFMKAILLVLTAILKLVQALINIISG